MEEIRFNKILNFKISEYQRDIVDFIIRFTHLENQSQVIRVAINRLFDDIKNNNFKIIPDKYKEIASSDWEEIERKKNNMII